MPADIEPLRRRKLLRAINRNLGTLILRTLHRCDRFFRLLGLASDPPSSMEAAAFSNILVIKLVGLGDTVLMLPALKRLKESSRARITALVTPASSGILPHQPYIDDVIVYDVLGAQRGILGFLRLILELRRRRFDLVIDFEQHLKLVCVLSYLTGARATVGFDNEVLRRGDLLMTTVRLDGTEHMVTSFDRLLEPLGIHERSQRLEAVRVPRAAADSIGRWLVERDIGNDDLLVGIHAGSGPSAASRRWPAARFAAIADRIAEQKRAKVVLTGNRDELPLVEEVRRLMRTTPILAAGQLPLEELIALMSRLALFLSNDTGPMHLAASLCPTVGLFGPGTPVRYGPFGPGHAALFQGITCSPCIQVHHALVPDCANPVFQECMLGIGVEEVWKTVERKLVPAPQRI